MTVTDAGGVCARACVCRQRRLVSCRVWRGREGAVGSLWNESRVVALVCPPPQGHRASLAAVGRSLLVGEGVKKNVKKGLATLQRAAEDLDVDGHGEPEALFVLSTCYSVGMPGVRIDKKKGEK